MVNQPRTTAAAVARVGGGSVLRQLVLLLGALLLAACASTCVAQEQPVQMTVDDVNKMKVRFQPAPTTTLSQCAQAAAHAPAPTRGGAPTRDGADAGDTGAGVAQKAMDEAPDPCAWTSHGGIGPGIGGGIGDIGSVLPGFNHLKSKIIAFYKKHEPAKVLIAHNIFRDHSGIGELDELYRDLRVQYCGDPAIIKSEL
jgi:hypothetical protein|eukprot:COSAG06_NODE_7678_length_2417_cov_3.201467_2_plen_198_part_00